MRQGLAMLGDWHSEQSGGGIMCKGPVAGRSCRSQRSCSWGLQTYNLTLPGTWISPPPVQSSEFTHLLIYKKNGPSFHPTYGRKPCNPNNTYRGLCFSGMPLAECSISAGSSLLPLESSLHFELTQRTLQPFL